MACGTMTACSPGWDFPLCIATGAVVGIDIDILDGALAIQIAELATSMLGDTPCLRIGRSPKRLLVYRAATPFAGRKRHPLELLARGQQFVAYAVHPDTGRPYEWPEDSLVETPLSRLPVVDEASCAAFLDAAWQLVPDEVRVNSILADAPTSTWRGPSDPKGTRDAIAAALAWLPNDDLPGNEWITVGAAIKAAIGEEGRDLWLDWSRRCGKSGQSGRSDTPERRWASLRPHSVGAGKIYWLAEQRGWVPDPALTLNGTAVDRGPSRSGASLSRRAPQAAARGLSVRRAQPLRHRRGRGCTTIGGGQAGADIPTRQGKGGEGRRCYGCAGHARTGRRHSTTGAGGNPLLQEDALGTQARHSRSSDRLRA